MFAAIRLMFANVQTALRSHIRNRSALTFAAGFITLCLQED